MKKNLCNLLIVLSVIFLGSQYAAAAATEWKLDPIHSNFYFDVDHTYATVRGYFKDFSGTFHFDADNLKESKMVFKIKTKSINTNERKRNNHLRTDEFFDVKKYPLITFVSKNIQHAGGDKYLVEGDLTIKDVTKAITLYLTYFGKKTNPLQPKETVAGFEAGLKINRFDYHVGPGKYYDMGVLGKDVNILITLEVLRSN